jgi:hypothetical protein
MMLIQESWMDAYHRSLGTRGNGALFGVGGLALLQIDGHVFYHYQIAVDSACLVGELYL